MVKFSLQIQALIALRLKARWGGVGGGKKKWTSKFLCNFPIVFFLFIQILCWDIQVTQLPSLTGQWVRSSQILGVMFKSCDTDQLLQWLSSGQKTLYQILCSDCREEHCDVETTAEVPWPLQGSPAWENEQVQQMTNKPAERTGVQCTEERLRDLGLLSC